MPQRIVLGPYVGPVMRPCAARVYAGAYASAKLVGGLAYADAVMPRGLPFSAVVVVAPTGLQL